MNRVEELQAAIRAIGRPTISFSTSAERDSTEQQSELQPMFASRRMMAMTASAAAARKWDSEHPVEAARYRKLVDDLEREVKRVEREDVERRRVERAVRTSASKLERSGIGPRSLEAAAEPEDTEALAATKRWLAQPGLCWLVLCGPKGTGKSVAATWAVREVIRSGSDGAFRRVSEVTRLSGFDAGAVEMEHLKRVAILVLDDFGTELLNDYAKQQLHELLDYRHENYARTIITSNLHWYPTKADSVGLIGRLGERLADRITQSGGGMLKLITGESFRQRKGSAE